LRQALADLEAEARKLVADARASIPGNYRTVRQTYDLIATVLGREEAFRLVYRSQQSSP
jgi:uncharacterized protein YbjQ (UPF0145 family)